MIWLIAAALTALTSEALAMPGRLPGVAPACEAEMVRAAELYGVPLGVLYAVALTESGRRMQLQPLAMNIEGTPFFARSLPEALSRFQAERARGRRLIDVGCMQVNHHYHGASFRSVAEMFDPRANVQYAARFLRDLHRRQGSWTMAVARYHAGPNNTAAQRRYICQVIASMAAAGVGAPTQKSRSFCA